MTAEERRAHKYRKGDRAICVDAPTYGRNWGDYTLHMGDVIEVTNPTENVYGIPFISFMGNGVRRSIRQEFMEPVGATGTCTCPIATLMTTGCTCGGS